MRGRWPPPAPTQPRPSARALAKALAARTVAVASPPVAPRRRRPCSPGRWTTRSAPAARASSAMSAASYLPRTAIFAVFLFGTSLSITSFRVSAAFMTSCMCVFCRLATDSAVATAASAALRVCSSSRRWRASSCCCALALQSQLAAHGSHLRHDDRVGAPRDARPVVRDARRRRGRIGGGVVVVRRELRAEERHRQLALRAHLPALNASNSARTNAIIASGGTFSRASSGFRKRPATNESPRFGTDESVRSPPRSSS